MVEVQRQMGRQSMECLLRLQGVMSSLARALTPEEVARVIVLQGGPALGAHECSIHFREEPGLLRLVQVVGMPEVVDFERRDRLGVDLPAPVAEAARTGAPVWVESLEELRRRYPAVAEVVERQGARAWACLPLESPGGVLGVLTLGFEREQGFSEEDREFACLVARQCAQFLERAWLYGRERELREEAERARAEAEAHRRELEQEQRRLRAILQQLPQAVLIAEAPSGRMVMASDQVARLRGGPVPADWCPEEYLKAATGFHPDGRPYLQEEWPLMRAITTGEEVRDELIHILHPEGVRFSLEVSAGPVRDAEGRVRAAVAILNDVTARLRMERTAREGQAIFRRIMESELMGLSFCDREGVLHEANDAFLALVGHEREELARGRLRWQELVPPEAREVGDRGLRVLWARGESPTFELELLRADGSRVPVLTGAALLEEQDRILAFVMDLSDLKRAEGALRLLATASRILGQSLEAPDATLQQVACLVSLSVASWCVIDVVEPEQGGLRRLAVAHQEPEREVALRRGWPLPALDDSGGPLLGALHSGEPLLFQDFGDETWRHLTGGAEPPEGLGGWLAGSVLVVPLRSRERGGGLLALGSCLTHRRYGQEDIALAQELAHRVAAALERAQLFQDSQRAVRLRDEFLAVASHELKTPLTPLRLQLQGLRRHLASLGGQPVAPERVLRAVEGCEAQVRKLAGLVNDLLDVSRLSQGQLPLRLEVVDLRALTGEVLEQFSAEAARAGCRVELVDGSPVVGRWDRMRLEQVVTNLLSNALKYGAGKPIQLRVWVEGGVARLSVRDDGIGIDPEHRARIFGKFERAVSERHYGGLGLGLHITQRIVHAHGGSIRVESEPGRGSTFTVELPLGAAARREDMLPSP